MGAAKKATQKEYRIYPAAPYVRSRVTTGDIMFVVVLSLLPCAGVGLYHYGFHAALLIGISVGTAIAAELVCGLIWKRGSSVLDYSCVVTGLIGGLILPPQAPLWTAAALSAMAIVVFKHAFGGLGRNLFNPAMAAKLVLLLACHDIMSDYGTWQYTGQTPLILLESGETPALSDMLTGNVAGCIGTSSAMAVLVAAAILLASGVIDLVIPLCAVAGFALCYLAAGEYGLSLYTQCIQICGGSFLFTVCIMAGDYTTSPLSKRARGVYGLLLGAFTFLLRRAGFTEEACVCALVLVNALRPALDAKLRPRPFGAGASRWVVREPKRRRRAQPAQTSARAVTNEQLDEEFGRFEEQIERQAAGLETARYTGDDSLLREIMEESGMEERKSPSYASGSRMSPYGSGRQTVYREYDPDVLSGWNQDSIRTGDSGGNTHADGPDSVVTDTSAIDLNAILTALNMEDISDEWDE